ncbi:peptide hydrolase [Trypanosoma cruzi]|nr:peptide hydrolase [Trypanosoma cruzi]
MISPCWSPTPKPPPDDGQEQLNIEIWYLTRPEVRQVLATVESSQCLAIFAETKRRPVIVAAAVTTASNGPCSSMNLSYTWTSPCWRTKSNMRAPMSLHPVAV